MRWLAELRTEHALAAGEMGANLGELMAAGLPVADGFVVGGSGVAPELGALADEVRSAYAELGPGAEVVVGSAAWRPASLERHRGRQVARSQSELTQRLRALWSQSPDGHGPSVPLLVQLALPIRHAGSVSAGDRGGVVVHQAVADGRSRAPQSRSTTNGLSARQRFELVEFARRAVAHFGGTVEMDWAVADAEMYVLGSRPWARR